MIERVFRLALPLFAAVAMAIPLFAGNGVYLDAEQRANLRLCYEITVSMGNDPDIVCPIMLVESSARLTNKSIVGDMQISPFKRSYGIMQVRFPTLKLLIRRLRLSEYRNVPDEVLLAKLMFDREFSVKAANWYISWLKKTRRYGKNYMYAVAYNSGIYKKSNVSYKRRYLDSLNVWRKFKKRLLERKEEPEIILLSNEER